MSDEPLIDRRCFILGACGALVAGCNNTVQKTAGGSSVELTPDANNVVTLDLNTYPRLQSVNGGYRFTVKAASGTKVISVVRLSSDSFSAVNLLCTHAGCTVNDFDAGAATFTCPCHGAVYSSTGVVIQGPATVNLTTYSAVLSGNEIRMTVS